jgi:L-cysteine/cystine lyase
LTLNIEAIRAELPATSEFIYLNTGWQGPSPLSVTRAVQEAFACEASGPTAPPRHEYRLAIFRQARQSLADLIGATAAEVSLQQNTTEGINIVLFGLGLQPGDEVITCSLEHSSVIVPAYYSRDRLGARLKIVRVSNADAAQDIVAKFEAAASPALKLILLSHISYASGQTFPVQELSQLAHRQGGYLLLDAAQSVGQIPFDVRELDCDFCAFPGHKWLLGPAGTGALYVRRELIERLNSPKVAHHASEFFNFKDQFRPKVDAIDKFELTTVSVPLLAGLNAAIEFVKEIGLDTIRDRALHLARYATTHLVGIANLRLVSTADPTAVASGLVSFALPGVPPATLTAYLWERSRVVARTVPDAACTRLSLDVFNTEAEVEAVVEALSEAAEHGVPEQEYPSIQLEWDAMVEL